MPEIVAVVLAVTEEVLTAKEEEVEPCGTVTDWGSAVTLPLLVLRETTAPPLGAEPLRVTVPVDGLPPITELGFKLTDETVRSDVPAGTKTTSTQ